MRCCTSGRLTPAAATLTRTCPAPGLGVGTSRPPSAPPVRPASKWQRRSSSGACLPCLVLLIGGERFPLRLTCPRAAIETRGKSCQTSADSKLPDQEQIMDWDEQKPRPAKAVTLGEDLRTLSDFRTRAAPRGTGARDGSRSRRDPGQEGARGRGGGRLQDAETVARRIARPRRHQRRNRHILVWRFTVP